MTNQFYVTVDPSFISKSPYFFNSTIEDIFTELLQNSRRAGASQVHIETKEDENGYWWVSVKDNGCGFFFNNDSIQLGGSKWDDEIKDRETPAGVGIFSLANRGCLIESNGLSAVLTKEHFTGVKAVTLTPSDYIIEGTVVTFPAPELKAEKENLEKINSLVYHSPLINNLTKYYPLRVFFNGIQTLKLDFGKHTTNNEKLLNHVYYNGLEIYIYGNGTHDFDAVKWDFNGAYINFYGAVINIRDVIDISVITDLLEKRGKSFFVKINVVDCPNLELVLPDRKRVIENEFFEELKQFCQKEVYKLIAQQKDWVLPYSQYKRAKELGVEINECPAQLLSFVPYYYGEEVAFDNYEWDEDTYGKQTLVNVDDKTILVTLENEVGRLNDHILALALVSSTSENLEGFKFVEPLPILAGYSWYDNLKQIEKITPTYRAQDGEFCICEVTDKLAEKVNEINLTVVWKAENAEESYGQLQLSLPFALVADYDGMELLDDPDNMGEVLPLDDGKDHLYLPGPSFPIDARDTVIPGAEILQEFRGIILGDDPDTGQAKG